MSDRETTASPKPIIAIIRDGLGTERARIECMAACDPVAVYAVSVDVQPVRLRAAGWTAELVPQSN